MFRNTRLAAIASIAICVMASASIAVLADPPVADGDIMFGHRDLELGIDRDVIQVGNELGKFNRIRLRVLGNTVHVVALRVVYEDRSHRDFPVEADIAANTLSGWFDVDAAQFIQEVQLTYRARPGGGAARVEVTGQYAKGWLDAAGEGRGYHEGWMLLGAQTAGFTGFDHDTIAVGENEGFAHLRIEALERAITLKEIRVKFASGPDEVFAMRERVDPGKPYGPLDIGNGNAPIKSIEAVYRSRLDLQKGLQSILDGPAVVRIWAQH
ncbi:MAG: hypothetical protein AB7S70_03485 [Hyphomicrobium sp.]|uniref:hypothetical protein n=1 Tax=Hyphomicrobium sp. TaxID=82 RepID=UPI003D1208A9